MKLPRLPPLGALRAFHVVATELSFKQAAIKLNVSATAISHQIRLLESVLDCRLFDRNAREVRLTDVGRTLFGGTQSAFTALETAVSRIDKSRQPPKLILTTTSNFLTHWLVPRLAYFTAQFPQIDVHLHTSVERIDLTQRTVDVAIRYRETPEEGLDNTLLYQDRFAVVASPSLGIAEVNDLHTATLIHVENRHVPKASPDWPKWVSQYGPVDLNTQKGLHFSEEMHALQAAVAGQGVVIASRLLTADMIRRNILDAPFGDDLPGANYYLVALKEVAERPDVRAFRAWLMESMREFALS